MLAHVGASTNNCYVGCVCINLKYDVHLNYFDMVIYVNLVAPSLCHLP